MTKMNDHYDDVGDRIEPITMGTAIAGFTVSAAHIELQ